jgi:hypothetical protein
MDPNIPVQQQPLTTETQTPVTPTTPFSPKVPSSKTKYILLGVLILLIIAAVGGGAYYLGVVKQQSVVRKNNNVTTATVTPFPTSVASQTPMPSIDPTANWKTLDTGQISIKYPPEWTYKYISEDGQYQIYNPNIMENVGTNGGIGNQHAYVSLPKEYVFVNSITTSTKTAIQEAQDYKQQWINLNEDSTILGSKTINGINFALYTDQGEASRYNDLAVSNGKVLVKINTSMKGLDGNDIENQIINTLKFTQ